MLVYKYRRWVRRTGWWRGATVGLGAYALDKCGYNVFGMFKKCGGSKGEIKLTIPPDPPKGQSSFSVGKPSAANKDWQNKANKVADEVGKFYKECSKFF